MGVNISWVLGLTIVLPVLILGAALAAFYLSINLFWEILTSKELLP